VIVLALDTALSACAAAVTDGDRVLAARVEPMQRGHQERLAPMVAELMHQAGIGFDRLDRVGVTVGPGSFTGLRVGLAFAKGLSLARAIPCVGIGTLHALAASLADHGPVAAVIDARRDQFYLQPFEAGESLSAPAMLPGDAAAERLRTFWPEGALTLTGPAADLLAPWLPGARCAPRASPDPLAVARLTAAAREPLPRPEPLYLRVPDARTIAERTATP
jgi:tRNA threonylcarbamoyladenosine biosynthesis protein TsaB